MPADSQVELNLGSGGALIATDLVSGKQYQVVKFAFGGSGVADEVTTANPLPVQILGTPALPADAAKESKQDVGNTSLANLVAKDFATDAKLELIRLLLAGTLTVNLGLTDSELRATPVAISAATLPLPTGAATAANQQTDALTNTQLRAAAVPTKETTSSTGGDSTASISTSATVLAANSSRLGATIYNESGGACRIKLGATASATSYTMIIAINGYYEVPYGYTGIITGIAVSGTAVLRITELT